MKSQNQTGLDYDFLRYIGVEPETQKRIQGFYLPFFEGCKRVVDLGCGDGDFLELLEEEGIEAIGVDRDQRCWAAARDRGLEVICKDVFDYLEELDEESVDGIFSAHLVEHLPYEKVIELFRLSYRAVKKEGRIVITTPNVRGLIAHLEMFYMHFGHVSFYHPKLLCFFLEHVGFEATEMGENPETASPLLSGIRQTPNEGGSEEVREPGKPASPVSPGIGAAPDHEENDETVMPTSPAPQEQGGGQSPHSKEMRGDAAPLVSYDLRLPLARDTIFHRLFRVVKMFAIRLIVQPYLDRITVAVNTSLAQVNSRFAQVDGKFGDVYDMLRQIRELDRPFECYVTAIKGEFIGGSHVA